jgi:hypothetical protein
LKELYLPPSDRFVLVDVPEMRFVVIKGEGDHSTDVFRLDTRWLFSVITPTKPVARERMAGRHGYRDSSHHFSIHQLDVGACLVTEPPEPSLASRW